jgi:3-hydroxymyristoyl/3-hydroxydecanoyl-(acyl carrier protein) dehydratase
MTAETTLLIAPDHPAFAGHFPGMPIVPGVVLLDAALHAALQAQAPSAGAGDGTTTVCRISSAKFLSPVGPGETLSISCAIAASGSTHFDISSGKRKVATGALVFAPLP